MQLGPPLSDLHSLLRDGVTTGLTDDELLDRFVARPDEAGQIAFATLVARHGPMVLGVCLRILGNPADADDAFQATFLVLVQRAGAVRFGSSLGPWLHGVSVRVARRARDVGSRHRKVGLDDEMVGTIPDRAVQADRDLRSAVDEALARLPANYRAVIVSCYLEGLTHEEAAKRLCCPVGTVRSRLARGRALLKKRFERSRLGPVSRPSESTRMLELGIAESIVCARLVDTTARTASRLAAGQPLAEVVSRRLAGLVAGAARTMKFSKLALAASLIIFAGLAAWGAAGLAAGPPGATAPAPSAPAAEATREDDPLTSYPYTIEPDNVREYPELTVNFRDLQLTSGPVVFVPIDCARGTTGVMLIGDGTFRFAPEKDKAIEGRFRAVLLRFNPMDLAALVSLEKGKNVRDVGAVEMTRHMLQTVLRHSYQSSREGGRRIEVLIPKKGALAAVLYSKEHGDLLISGNGREVVVFNFTEGKTLYERK
jgi:RNA polymerase sigma factor (sigma-70 family)